MFKVIRSIRTHWLVWAYPTLLLLTLGIVLLWKPSGRLSPEYDFHIRTLALVLQLIGTATVWWDLTRTAKEHGAGLSFRKAWESVKSALGRRPSISATALIIEGAESTASVGRVSILLSSQQPIETRLANLENFAQRLDTELGSVQVTMSQQNAKQTADLKQLGKDLRREIKTLEGKITEAQIGNFAVLHFGILWVMVGMAIASFPVEITDWGVAAQSRLSNLLHWAVNFILSQHC